jgi:hypothetical protein
MSDEASPPDEPSTSNDTSVRRTGLGLEDVVGLLFATLFGVTSLVVPFGRDQGLYFYVAREWALAGKIPYRDVFDHKTPGIYVMHYLSIRLFGETMWGIRVFDWLTVIGTAFVVAWLRTPRGEKIARGDVGRAALFVTVLFYGVLNFWDSAQSELQYTLFGLLSVAAARKYVAGNKAMPVLAGFAMGLALVMKPPVMWIGTLTLVTFGLQFRAERTRAKEIVTVLALLGAGATLPIASTLGYFAKHHALAAMKDIVVGANGYYVSHEHAKNPFLDGIDSIQGYLSYTSPIVLSLLLGSAFAFAFAKRAGDQTRAKAYKSAFAVAFVCFLCVAMQMKFYLLHFTPMVAPMALLGVLLSDDVSRGFESRGFGPRFARAVPWLVVTFAFFMASWTGRRLVEQQMAAARYLSGQDDRQTFLHRFSFPDTKFDYADSEWVGLWLRDHTTPDETVLVRGFQPEVYVSARRSAPGRFFWSLFLTNPSRAYRREEYLAEDREAFERKKPRYVVARRDKEEVDLDHPKYYEALGYRIVAERGFFVIMERVERAELRTPTSPAPR